ncbi:MAG: GUN4 domain-containing protein [Limnoraphis sp. WC205]|nr:GUN4 domain-containing protein [Limnoraphis sp. WC205]
MTSNLSDISSQLQQIHSLLTRIDDRVSAIERQEAEILSILRQFKPFDPSEIQLKLLSIESQLTQAQQERIELNSRISDIPSQLEKFNNNLVKTISQELSQSIRTQLQHTQDQLFASLQSNIQLQLDNISEKQSQIIAEQLSSFQDKLDTLQNQSANFQTNTLNDIFKQVSYVAEKIKEVESQTSEPPPVVEQTQKSETPTSEPSPPTETTQNSETPTPDTPATENLDKKSAESINFNWSQGNYQTLESLLKEEQWSFADKLTLILINQACGQPIDFILDQKSIEVLPCRTLRIIDKLWIKYSSGKFGLSVQKKAFEFVGGKIGVDEYKSYCDFGKRVGWLVNNKWFYESDINYSSNAPDGHLPLLPFVRMIRGIRSRKLYFSDFLSKLQECEI